MEKTIELQDPQNKGTFVEKRGQWCNYHENGKLFASNLTLNAATRLFHLRQWKIKAENFKK